MYLVYMGWFRRSLQNLLAIFIKWFWVKKSTVTIESNLKKEGVLTVWKQGKYLQEINILNLRISQYLQFKPKYYLIITNGTKIFREPACDLNVHAGMLKCSFSHRQTLWRVSMSIIMLNNTCLILPFSCESFNLKSLFLVCL
jgi:hypothetical protein